MPKIVVEGPDGKKYAFPDTMPREQINTFMKERYGTKARDETVSDYLARVVREQDATKARAKSVTKEATAAGRAEGERAAERMGVNNAFEMAMAAPAIGMAQQAGARRVFNEEGTMLPDEAAGLAALNTAGFFIPGMVNERFGQRVEEGRRQQPLAAFSGDVAGGMIGGELIGLGLQKAGQAIAPGVSAIGRMFKGKPAAAPAAAPEPPMVLGPQNRILPVDRPDALPGDDVEMARALDAWTPPVEQQVRPMGFGSGRGYTDRLNATTTISEAADVIARSRFKPAKRMDRAATAEDWTDATEEAADILRVEAQRQGGNDAAAQVVREFSPDSVADPKGKPRLVYEDLAAQILRSKGIDPEPVYGPMKADRLTNAERGVNAKLMKQAKGEAIVNDQMIDEFGPDIAAAERAKPPRLNSLLTERGRDAVEQTFGAAYMSGTGSVAGGQYDLNGDGEIDNTDLAIGSGIGLAAFASPLALRKVAELGGRLKGTKAQGMAPKPPETPQQAARYETPGSPEYEAAIAKGLDMSTPARMARAKEMGFDTETVFYHGSPERNIKSFRTGEGLFGRGVSVTSDISHARAYKTASGKEGGADFVTSAARQITGKVYKLRIRGKGVPAQEYDDLLFVEMDKGASEARAHAIVRSRLAENGITHIDNGAHKIVFDPANIRSVNAAFDPDKAASPILTAGLGGKR